MLTEVKNQFHVTWLSIKYAFMREMLNKVTLLSNVFFMILNNASMIIQWIVLYSIKDDIGGYTFQELLLLWGIAAGAYGVAHFFFEKSFHLSDAINSGKLDAYIVQPKNILLSAITSDIKISALGDILFSILVYFFVGFSIGGFFLFLFFIITGGILLTTISIILNSLSFWFQNTDLISDVGNTLMVNFGTYPDGIFKGVTRALLFTIIPIGIAYYIPVKIITEFNLYLFVIDIGVCLLLVVFAYIIFYKGIKRYSSSNLMSSRI